MKRSILFLALFVSCICAPLAGAQNAFPPAPNRVVGAIDETQRVTLKNNVHPLALRQFDNGAAPGSTPTGRIRLLFQRSTEQQQELTQYLSDLQNPASTAYHKWLTPGQFGTAFGVSQSDLLQVQSWLQSHGFKIDKVPAAHNGIEFSGTFDQVQSAFQTSIHTFMVNGETHFANVSDPQVPAALAPVIAAVGPLNDFHAKPMLVRGPNGRFDPSTERIVPQLTLESDNTLYLFADPADAATIYDTPNNALNPAYSGTTYNGAGVAIGIVGVSDLTLADVANYRMAFLGETSGSVNLPTVIVDGNDPGLNDAGDEALLDTEVSGGIAPKASIYFYTSADTDISSGLLNAIFRALDDNRVSILSVSFSDCEAALGASGNQILLEAAEQAAAQGITLTVSAGDNGSAGCDDFDSESQATQGFAVNGYASTPYSIAVGGTDFDVLSTSFASYVNNTSSGSPPYYGTALKYIPENPWNNSTARNTTFSINVPNTNSKGVGNIVAGSGGVSTVYSKPAFQSSLTPSDGFRDLPDVSLFAANGLYQATWVFCSDNVTDEVTTETYTECQTTNGQLTSNTVFGGVGGTSASAPAFAGMMALVAQAHGAPSDNYRLGQVDTILYQLAQSRYSTVFHDVTTGNNSVACVSGSPDCGSNNFLTGYNAGTGYDLASGLGSVDAAAMVNNWTSVSLASTSTTFQINGSSTAYTGIYGANLALSTGVTSSSGTPTGVVAITDNADLTAGGTASGPQGNGQTAIPLTAGSGSATWNGLPGGNYTVSARYGGDTSFAASTSAPISISISPEPSTTSLAVNAYNPSTGKSISTTSIPYGSYVFAHAVITGTAEGSNSQGLATGTVKILNNGAPLGSSPVSSGNQASWPPITSPFGALPAGNDILTAQYSGDASFNASASSGTSVTVIQGQTSLAVPDATPNLGYVGEPITLFTTVSTSGFGAAPTGSVAFMSGSTPLGSAVISGTAAASSATTSGTATLVTTALPEGANSVIATYPGDSNYSGSTSGAYLISVSKGFLSGINIVANPSTFAENQPVSIIVTAVQPAGAPIPTGTVTLNYDTTTIVNVTANLSGGSVTFNFPANTFFAGAEDFTATYNGDTNYNSKVDVTDISINPSGTITPAVLVTGPSAPVSSYPFTITVTVSGPPGDPTPTGIVQVKSSLEQLSNGAASFSFADQEPGGNNTITATYYGDANYTGGSGSTIVIIRAASSIAFSPTSLSTAVNEPLNVTVSVTGAGVNLPAATGTMTLSSGSYSSSAVSLSNGAASFTIPANTFAVGSETLTAAYSGDTYYSPGSNTVSVNVTAAPPPSFSLSASAAGPVTPGGSTTSTISVTPSGGFTGAVNLTCTVSTSITGYIDLPTCSIPSSVTISGTNAATATMTVSTTAPSSAALRLPLHKFLAGGGGALAILLLFGIPARRRASRVWLSFLAVLLIAGAVGCGSGGGGGGGTGGGGGGNSGTTPGSYSAIVTGTDVATGKIISQTTVTLIVN